MLVNLYDLFIMLPLGIERLVSSGIKRRAVENAAPARGGL